MRRTLAEVVKHVGTHVGPGHSECVYQKALSLLLQQKGIRHSCEFNVPISMQGPAGEIFNIGGERIDILLYDDDKRAYILELKAIAASVLLKHTTSAALHAQSMSTQHMQAMKYIRMKPVPNICGAYVVNFRQAATFGDPGSMAVELVEYDAAEEAWTNVTS